MRAIDHIIIHCAATQPHWMEGKTAAEKRDEIDRWHKGRGWKGFGYHYLIDRDGTVVAGRPLEEVGAHTKGQNKASVGVCLVGGHGSSENDAFLDNYTFAQEQALRVLISELKVRVPTITKISGHNQWAAKACPGFNVPRWLANKAPSRTVSESTTVRAAVTQVTTAAGGGVMALTQLDGDAQKIALILVGVVVLSALWILRERVKKFAKGIH